MSEFNNFQTSSFFLFFLPLIFSTVFFYWLLGFRFGKKNKIIVEYRKNKRWGGIVVGISFIILLTLFQSVIPGFLLPKDFFSLIIGALILLVGGIWDDLKDLNWKKQLLIQALAAIVIVGVGDTINHIRLPGGGVIFLPFWLSLVSAFLWVTIIINSLNWFDGVDGLSGSVSLVNLLILAALSVSPLVNQPNTALLCLILAGIVLGFLFFNFSPAEVYLGSAGVWIIGFVIAVISLYSGGKIATASLIFGFPLLNFVFVSFKRISLGKWPTIGGDRLHLHEKLIDRGFRPGQVTLVISLLSFLIGVCALSLQTQGKFLLFTALLIFFLLFYWSLKRPNSQKEK